MKILLRLPLPMTKEEKKAKGKEEEEVPEGFIDAVNEFYESSDIIFKCFDDIYNDYLQGKDIREELKGFRRTKPIIYWLLAWIYNSSAEELKGWFDKAGIEEEKRKKIFLFHNRFSDLASEISSVDSEEVYGLVNFGVGISPKFIFNEEYNFPIIELKVFSGSKEVLYLKLPSSIVYSYANLLQTTVKNCLNEIKDRNIAAFEIESIKETANDVRKEAEKILGIIEEIEKR